MGRAARYDWEVIARGRAAGGAGWYTGTYWVSLGIEGLADWSVMGDSCFGRVCWLMAAGHEVSSGMRFFLALAFFPAHSEHLQSPCFLLGSSGALETLRL